MEVTTINIARFTPGSKPGSRVHKGRYYDPWVYTWDSHSAGSVFGGEGRRTPALTLGFWQGSHRGEEADVPVGLSVVRQGSHRRRVYCLRHHGCSPFQSVNQFVKEGICFRFLESLYFLVGINYI